MIRLNYTRGSAEAAAVATTTQYSQHLNMIFECIYNNRLPFEGGWWWWQWQGLTFNYIKGELITKAPHLFGALVKGGIGVRRKQLELRG